MKKLRQSTVEPVLGTLVNFLAMRRVNIRGISLANKCMLMAAASYNLKKLLRFKAPKSNAEVKQVWKMADKAVQNRLFLLFAATGLPQCWYYQKQPNRTY